MSQLVRTAPAREVAPARRVQTPPRWKVVMLNDDFTPMEFVVSVLQSHFQMNQERAVAVMLEVHHKGRAVAGVYVAEIAETKAAQVNQYARKSQHPLLCVVEKD